MPIKDILSNLENDNQDINLWLEDLQKYIEQTYPVDDDSNEASMDQLAEELAAIDAESLKRISAILKKKNINNIITEAIDLILNTYIETSSAIPEEDEFSSDHDPEPEEPKIVSSGTAAAGQDTLYRSDTALPKNPIQTAEPVDDDQNMSVGSGDVDVEADSELTDNAQKTIVYSSDDEEKGDDARWKEKERAKLKALTQEMTKLQEENARLELEHAALFNTHADTERKLEHLRAQYALDVNALKRQINISGQEDKAQAMRDAAKQIKDLQERVKEQKAQLTKIESTNQALQDQLQKLQKDHQNDIDRLKRAADKKDQDHQAEIERFKKTVEEGKKREHELTSQIQQLSSSHQSFHQDRNEYQKQLDQLKIWFDFLLDGQAETELDKYKIQGNETILTITAKIAGTIAILQTLYGPEIEKAYAEYYSTVQTMLDYYEREVRVASTAFAGLKQGRVKVPPPQEIVDKKNDAQELKKMLDRKSDSPEQKLKNLCDFLKYYDEHRARLEAHRTKDMERTLQNFWTVFPLLFPVGMRAAYSQATRQSPEYWKSSGQIFSGRIAETRSRFDQKKVNIAKKKKPE